MDSVEDQLEESTALQIGKKAPIWEHYRHITSTQTAAASATEEAQCKYCTQKIKTNYGNTTGMRRHLENKHFAKFLLFKKCQSEFDAKKSEKRLGLKPSSAPQPGPSTSSVSAKSVTDTKRQSKLTDLSKWDSKNPRAVALTSEIGKWMVSSLHPYSLVDQEGFKRVMSLAQPKYNVPSSKTFSRSVIPTLYKDVKNVISRDLEQQKSVLASVSVTADMWTSLSNNAFLAVTTHFMDANFTLNNYCLGCYSFIGEHSGENICQKVNECLSDWDLANLSIPVYCITDNAKNIKAAMASCKDLKPLSCFAHTLQLALTDAKKATQGMTDLLSKARKIVGHYRHSSTATERLHTVQKEMGKEVLNLIQDVETRWNSEYLMLSRLLKNKEPVSRDLVSTGKLDNLTVSEWRMVEAYVNILEPLYQATVEMCSSIKPTASLVIPILYCVQEKLTGVISDNLGVGKMFSRQLLLSLKSRFPNSLKIDPYLSAMLVDPRFKDIALDPHERSLGLSELKKKIMTAKGQLPPEETLTEEKAEDKSKSLWSVFMKAAAKKASEPKAGSELERKVDDELKIYFGEPTILPSEDPCEWWRKNAGRFPLMKILVQQYLGIPATEVASERTFSSAGNVITSLRERLTSEHAEELVFLHQNSKVMYEHCK